MEHKKYFFEEIAYTMSDLRSVDSALLEGARAYLYYEVTATWIQQFAAYLRRRQDEILSKNKRAKAVDISYVFPDEMLTHGARKTAVLRCGRWYARFVLIREDETTFQEPLL